MKFFKLFYFIPLVFVSCSGDKKKEEIDLFIFNAKIYTADSSFSVKDAIAIDNGKIVFVGKKDELPENFLPLEMMDVQGKAIFPGFIDAHCHFLHYGLGLTQVDLVGTKSFNEVIERVVEFSRKNKEGWIIGRGWDQNDWDVKEYPDRKKLDSLFPDRPVFLKRIDGHAAIANKVALMNAGVNGETRMKGGKVEVRLLFHGEEWVSPALAKELNHMGYTYPVPTGILIDNAVDLVDKTIPSASQNELKDGLLAAQKNCFAVGLTTVDDAGLMKSEIDFIDSLQKTGELKMRIYAMLSDSAPNYEHYLKAGPYKTDYLNVRSFKFYADGALGSRGACLKEDYSDKKGWKGFLLNSIDHFENNYGIVQKNKFQVNTHCIGDSSVKNTLIILTYGEIGMENADIDYSHKSVEQRIMRRNRIEHFQVFDSMDINYFNQGVIPSVQPTHATSDMYWAKERLGEKRMKYAYAYKTLLKNAGVIALGTDFPVEDISPFKTFYAAVFRKDSKGFPEGGFQIEEALTREETIRGMTIWAAYSNFEEKEKGSLEKGKFADFIILDTDLMTADEKDILKTKVLYTFINGEKVYEKK
ncbi:MAG: amidohydrolase [Bacteroidia bacterium]|nr:amidohydrolase [Bacteroidia bacterium]